MPAETLEAPETSVELLREFERTGRPEPFEAFMRRHASMVYATCLKVTRDPHDAEDATQATFLTLASKSRLNGEIRQPEAWLRKVAHRLSLDLIRSKKRRVNRENLRSEMTNEAAPLDSHDHANAGEVKGILNEELAKLPASYRMPLILHYFGGLSRDEMAEQLKLKPSTLGVRLHRAREQLRRKLAARGILLPSVALTALLSEVVRQGVCGHMMTSTAQQASAIAMGHASAPMLAASTGVDSIGSLLAMLSHGKLKVLLSAAILSTAISMTSAQVRLLIPESIRSVLPSFRLPTFSLPKLQFRTPLPRIAAAEKPTATPGDVAHEITAPKLLPPSPSRLAMLQAVAAKTVDDRIVAQASTPAASPPASAIAPPTPLDTVPLATRSGSRSPTRAVASASSERTSTERTSTERTSSAAALKASASAARPMAAAAAKPESDDLSGAGPVASGAAWDGVVPEPTGSGGGGGGGGAGAPPSRLFENLPLPAAVPTDVPAGVTAPVTGSVPALRDASGMAAGKRGEAAAAKSGSKPGGGSSVDGVSSSPARVPKTSRTVLFNGTSANYGGYSDESWKATQLNQVSSLDQSEDLGRLAERESATSTSSTPPGFSFNHPAIPGETLSVNGARVTLSKATGIDDAPANVRFVGTQSAQIPTLPDQHQFIGVWELDTATTFDSADLLVRYDDLRAARLGLNERILKLWVSDGDSWSLMWRDASFGRDINQNFMWVTTGGGVKFFAASAPEPATLAALIAGVSVLSIRRRRP